jgi:hypothetical protein
MWNIENGNKLVAYSSELSTRNTGNGNKKVDLGTASPAEITKTKKSATW